MSTFKYRYIESLTQLDSKPKLYRSIIKELNDQTSIYINYGIYTGYPPLEEIILIEFHRPCLNNTSIPLLLRARFNRIPLKVPILVILLEYKMGLFDLELPEFWKRIKKYHHLLLLPQFRYIVDDTTFSQLMYFIKLCQYVNQSIPKLNYILLILYIWTTPAEFPTPSTPLLEFLFPTTNGPLKDITIDDTDYYDHLWEQMKKTKSEGKSSLELQKYLESAFVDSDNVYTLLLTSNISASIR